MQKKTYLALLALSLALPVTPLTAAETPVDSPLLMDEVVVTATRTEEKRSEVPNAVVLVDRYEIEESPADGLGELLAGELGIDWRTQGNYGGAAQTLQIRGMSAVDTQVLVNGLSYNSPSLGLADVGTIPMNMIDRIEVVKGSGSLLYGSGAMAGTVSILSKRPEREGAVLQLSAGYGTEETSHLAVEQGQFVTDTFGYYLTANSRETDGFRDNGDLEHRDVSLNLVLEQSERFDVSFYADVIDREFGVPGIRPPAGTDMFLVGGIPFYNGESASLVDRGSSEDSHIVLAVKSRLTEWIGLNLQADYTNMESYNYQRSNAGAWGTLAGEGLESWIDNRILGLEGNIELHGSENMTLLLGADYLNHDWDTRSQDLDTNGLASGDPVLNSARIFTKGIYGEVQYRLLEPLKLTGGVRQEDHSTFGQVNLPRFGLVYSPMPGTAIKAGHGKHFKAPTPNDLFWPDSDFVSGNPDLKPQTGWHSDLTLEQQLLAERLFITGGLFDWDVEDKIDWAPNSAVIGPFGPKWTPTNLNKSTGHGLELGLRYQPTYALSLGASYTYTEAEDETTLVTRPAAYVPEHQARVSATWRHDTGLTTTAVLRYVDERIFYNSTSATEPSEVLASYTTVDLKAVYPFNETWSLDLSVDNLLDDGYDTNVGSYTDGSGAFEYGMYPGSGRSVFLNLTYVY